MICALVRKLSPNSTSAAIMAMGVNLLAKMLKWYLFALLMLYFHNFMAEYLLLYAVVTCKIYLWLFST